MNDAARPAEPAAHLGRRTKLLLLAFAGYTLAVSVASPPWSIGTGLLFLVGALVAWLVPLLFAGALLGHPFPPVRRHAWVLLFLLGIGSFAPWWAWRAGGESALFAALVLLPLLVGLAYHGTLRSLACFRAQALRRTVKLSAAIICKDEVDRIEPCLQALHGWADEIVVLDSGSIDGTQALARRYTGRVFETDWPGYGVQKQRALDRCSGEWVLSLDADEVISADLKREIDAHLAAPTRYTAFRFPWVSIIFGGPIDFGADGRYHTRLFRRDAARFDDAPVHEEAVVQGAVGTLWTPVYHHTFRDFAHLKRKFAEYAWLSARSRHAKGRSVTAVGAVLRGCASFLLLYFVRLGVLDGRRGLLMAVLYAHYTFDKYAGLWALNRSASRRDA
jgi:O-antigen ligase